MTDYPRNMRGYGPSVPAANWPGGARTAVQFVINFEEGGENCVLHGDTASESFLSEIVGAQPIEGQRHMNMESIYEYGSRAGFWRLHRMFTERDIPVTVFGVGMALERNQQAVVAMQNSGWEIASHGYRWIDFQDVDEATERAHLKKAIEVHERVTGERPAGWYLYWDYSYGEPQLMVPYTLDANDMRFATAQGFNSGKQFYNYLKDSFKVLHAEGGRMMSIGLHCRLAGRPGRAAAVAKFLDHVAKHDDAWVATRLDIARHWREHHPAEGND